MQLTLKYYKIIFFALLTTCLVAIIYILQPSVGATNHNYNETFEEITSAYTQFERAALAHQPNESGVDTHTLVKKNLTQIKATSAQSMDAIWGNIIRDFKLDHQANSPKVKAEIRKLLAEKGKFTKVLTDASPFIYYINTQIKARHLPAEISLLPFIESEFNPNDFSNKGAAGLWQLMSPTARLLGVKVNKAYDGRRNLVFSTKAAITYFKDLEKNFKGNWILAIAAYNCGEFKVKKAVRRAGTENFWNLNNLPTETKLYVPRLLAVAEILSHPDKYHVQLPPVANTPYFSEFKTQKPVNIDKFAQQAGINLKTLRRLNADYKNTYIPKGTALLIPVNSKNFLV